MTLAVIEPRRFELSTANVCLSEGVHATLGIDARTRSPRLVIVAGQARLVLVD